MVAWAMSSSLVGTVALTTLMWSMCSLIVGAIFGFWTFTRNANLVAARLRGTASPLEPTRPLRPKDALWIIPLGIVMFVALDYLPALVSTEWLSVVMAGFVGWGLSSGLLVRDLESTVQEELDRGLLDPELVSQSPPGLRDLLGPHRMRMLLAVGLIALAAGLSSIWFGFSMLHSVTYSEPTRETVLTIKRAVTVWLPLGSTLLGATVLGATVDLLLWPLLLSRKLRSANRRQTIVLLNMGQRERLNWEALRVKYTRRAS